MPHKDPEVRKKYLRDYYQRNSDTIKDATKRNVRKRLENNPNLWAERYKNEAERDRANKYLRRYGITVDDYNRMFEEQDGMCLICERHQSTLRKSLSVDHCHQTGKVRGLLCTNCNTAIGKLGDSSASVMRAVEYLRRSENE